MAERDSWAVMNGASRVVDAEDSRIAMSALWTPGTSAVNARAGIRMAPGDPGKVSASLTPNTNVTVAKFQLSLPASRGLGSYTATLDADKVINGLATPADPSNARRDLIVAQQSDTYYADGSSAFVVRYVVGTPAGVPVDPAVSGSPDYYPIARVRVGAGATTITNAMIDDLRVGRQVGLGGILPVSGTAERNALTAYDGQTIYRQDKDWCETYDGTAWRTVGTVAVAAGTDITHPYVDQLVMLLGDHQLYRWTGSAWVRLQIGAMAGGRRYVSGSSLAVTSGTTEALTNTPTGSVSVIGGLAYKVKFQWNYNQSVADDAMYFRIRDTNLAGAEQVSTFVPKNFAGVPLVMNLEFIYKPGGSGTKVFAGTIQRQGGSGICTVTPSSSGGTYSEVTLMGLASDFADV